MTSHRDLLIHLPPDTSTNIEPPELAAIAAAAVAGFDGTDITPLFRAICGLTGIATAAGPDQAPEGLQ